MSEPKWRCKTCRFFTGPVTGSRNVDIGICTNEKLNDYLMCKDVELSNDELMYEFYEGGDIYVGPEFGCVHWGQEA